MNRKCATMIVTALGMAMATETWAAVSYSYETDAPSYDASSGAAMVNVYLHETLTSGSTSLLTAEGGIYGGGFRIDLLSGGGVKLNAFAANPALTGSGSASISDTVMSALATIPLGAPSGPTADGSGRILLGSVTLIPGGGGTSPATFALERIDNLGGNTLTYTNNYDLDFDSASPAFLGATGQATFTVAVPEPGHVALFAMAGMLLGSRRKVGWGRSR